MASIYLAHLAPQKDGGYVVRFPDLPGCVTEGDDLESAIANAREAMELWLDGEEAPAPGDPKKAAAAILRKRGVPVAFERPDPREKFVAISMTVPPAALKRIDRAAQRSGVSRSAFMVQAALDAAAPVDRKKAPTRRAA